jgi:hypothetical protein
MQGEEGVTALLAFVAEFARVALTVGGIASGIVLLAWLCVGGDE